MFTVGERSFDFICHMVNILDELIAVLLGLSFRFVVLTFFEFVY